MSDMAAPTTFALHAHGTTPERTASLRAVLASGPRLESNDLLRLAASNGDTPAAFDVTQYVSHLQARGGWARTRVSK
jgi:hypothetical protein